MGARLRSRTRDEPQALLDLECPPARGRREGGAEQAHPEVVLLVMADSGEQGPVRRRDICHHTCVPQAQGRTRHHHGPVNHARERSRGPHVLERVAALHTVDTGDSGSRSRPDLLQGAHVPPHRIQQLPVLAEIGAPVHVPVGDADITVG